MRLKLPPASALEHGEDLPYDLAVFIGRFQPFHDGHMFCVRTALTHSRFLLIVIGSANEARRPDVLPFTAQERQRMIEACLTNEEKSRIIFKHSEDVGNIEIWSEQVQGLAAEAIEELYLYTAKGGPKITLIGHSKDKSSYYLKSFSMWDSVAVPAHSELSATQIRKIYFSDKPDHVRAWLNSEGRRLMPGMVVDYLQDFMNTAHYANMVAEWQTALATRASWDAAPYPPTFITLDGCLIQAGHVLLVERKAMPGRGQWALPGGFLEQDEYLIDGCIRELREETKLKVPEAVLRGSLVATQVFDAPFRSMRGRTVTHCFLFHLQPRAPERYKNETDEEYSVRLREALALPKVKGMDDAAKAKWWPLDKVRRDMMFEDHYQIIQTMKAKISV